jgi:predicted ATP-grasp superfamily ATP-dependent carboligase
LNGGDEIGRLNLLVTGACGVSSRAIARSLRLSPLFRDATVIGTDRGGNWYGFYEELYDRVYRVPEPHDSEYAEVMRDVCRREAIDVALVVPEAEVLFWSEGHFPVPTLLPSPRFAQVAISKRKLYDALRDSGLVPRYDIVSRGDLLARERLDLDGEPVWLRDCSDASSSGTGSIKVSDREQAYAWAYLNPGIANYMVAEHLPGRNLACSLLFYEDELLRVGCYERLAYFMERLVISGVTGNICRGRLVNHVEARTVAEEGIRTIARQHGEPAHGLFTVDLREATNGSAKITEINVRHTAATSALAAGGANMAEAQVLATLGRLDAVGEVVVTFPEDNLILRDIDGQPLWVTDYGEPAVGEYVGRGGGVGNERVRLEQGLQPRPG